MNTIKGKIYSALIFTALLSALTSFIISRFLPGPEVLGIFFAIILPLLITGLVLWQLNMNIIAPLRKLVDAAWEIDKVRPPRIERDDEIGEIYRALETQSERLQTIRKEIGVEKKKTDLLLDQLSEGVIIVDDRLSLVQLNKAACHILRINNNDLQGKSFIEAARDYELNESLSRALKENRVISSQLEIKERGLYLGITAAPIPGGAVLIIQDLSDLKRLEKVRQDFVANISHELRTPLASIRALAETAEIEPAVASNYLEKIILEVDKLTQLSAGLGELSWLESDEMPLKKEPSAIQNIIREVVARFSLNLERTGLGINLEIEENLSQVNMDRDRIEEVLVNLLHNAIKFTPSGGKIIIGARRDKNGILIKVADTGIGIPPDDLPRVFERFYTVDKSHSRGASGLGLAISKHIIEAHQGKIWAESKPGKGSTFYFWLPLS